MIRNGLGFALGVPEDGDNIPARAIGEELDGVDASSEGLGIIWCPFGFVCAKDVGDVAKGFGGVGNL